MSVKVEYAPQPSPPPTGIVLRDLGGYALTLVATAGRPSGPWLRANVRGGDDYAAISPADARRLAAALIEWADSAEA